MWMGLDFGFYPRRYDHTIGDISITTLPELKDKLASVRADPRLRDGCICVQTPSRIFAMPKTHSIDCASAQGDEHVHFILWCFGFFVGMRMSWMEAGFLDSTPIREGAMSDIVWREHSLDEAIAGADAYWRKHGPVDPKQPKRITAAIHAYFLAHREGLLEYERFIFLYTAVDACFKVLRHNPATAAACVRGKNEVSHSQRIAVMCGELGVVLPDWAQIPASSPRRTQAPVVDLRNTLFHEGLFFDEPLGFAGFGDPRISEHLIGDLQALVSRFLVALLELPALDYIGSPLTSRANEGVLLP